MIEKKIGRWDARVDWGILWAKATELLNKYMGLFNVERSVKSARNFIYSSMAVTQLANGLRAKESFDAILRFAQEGKRQFQIQALKHGDVRWVVIPRMILLPMLREALGVAGKITLSSYKKFVPRKLGVNTHTLRYAFIRKLLNTHGYSADKIAVILGHKKLETTYHYEKSETGLRLLQEAIKDYI